MVWVLGSAPPPRPLPGPCCSLLPCLCLKALKCPQAARASGSSSLHSSALHRLTQVAIPTPRRWHSRPPTGGNADPRQVALPTPRRWQSRPPAGGTPDPLQVAMLTPSRWQSRPPHRWHSRPPAAPREDARGLVGAATPPRPRAALGGAQGHNRCRTPREKAPQAPGGSPTSAKNSSMKAVLSTAISTSSASSSCVSCSCETQRAGPVTTGLRLLRSPTFSPRLRPGPVFSDLLPCLKRSRIPPVWPQEPQFRPGLGSLPGPAPRDEPGLQEGSGRRDASAWREPGARLRNTPRLTPGAAGRGRGRTRAWPGPCTGCPRDAHGMPTGRPRGGALCPAPRGAGHTRSTWAFSRSRCDGQDQEDGLAGWWWWFCFFFFLRFYF
ncbi:unnamed protein product [Nyctereutes procyonoides]|uniref:(raccoon dog) hypothetical protein n=1 Tax=Nyctereutes procyonoides TaxID=34880 RepID=A0A811Y1F2_NYCPR|nr:unnamed protein product [Nyctereutes procyonoides]